jgi:N-acetylglucosamine kinase-like BadF-type ATPase
VVVRDGDGELFQAGGHEWVATDYGSGFWIGLQAIREAYRDLEDGNDSVLLQRMQQLYDVRSDDRWGLIEKVRELAVGDPNTKKEIAKFAASVCAAAERGDKAAQNIVKSEAESLADVTAKCFRRRFPTSKLTEGLKVVQCGSLLNNNFYRTSFETQLEMRLLMAGDGQAKFEWDRVVTATDAALQLAADLAAGNDAHLKLERAFRPIVLYS